MTFYFTGHAASVAVCVAGIVVVVGAHSAAGRTSAIGIACMGHANEFKMNHLGICVESDGHIADGSQGELIVAISAGTAPAIGPGAVGNLEGMGTCRNAGVCLFIQTGFSIPGHGVGGFARSPCCTAQFCGTGNDVGRIRGLVAAFAALTVTRAGGVGRPGAVTLIPSAGFHRVAVCAIGRNREISGLVPLIVPAITRRRRIHAAEDHIGITLRDFHLIIAVSVRIIHSDPDALAGASKEICRKAGIVNMPVSVGLEVEDRFRLVHTAAGTSAVGIAMANRFTAGAAHAFGAVRSMGALCCAAVSGALAVGAVAVIIGSRSQFLLADDADLGSVAGCFSAGSVIDDCIAFGTLAISIMACMLADETCGNRHTTRRHRECIIADDHIRLALLYTQAIQFIAIVRGHGQADSLPVAGQHFICGDRAVGGRRDYNIIDYFYRNIVRTGGGNQVFVALRKLVSTVVHTGRLRCIFFSVCDAAAFSSPLTIGSKNSKIICTIPYGNIHIVQVACFFCHFVALRPATVSDHKLDTSSIPVRLKIDSATSMFGCMSRHRQHGQDHGKHHDHAQHPFQMRHLIFHTTVPPTLYILSIIVGLGALFNWCFS